MESEDKRNVFDFSWWEIRDTGFPVVEILRLGSIYTGFPIHHIWSVRIRQVSGADPAFFKGVADYSRPSNYTLIYFKLP